MSFKTLTQETRNSVIYVGLNRPDVKNAMNAQMISEIHQFFSSIPDETRAIVIRSEGEFFCAGGDLNWMKSSIEKTPQENEEDALQLAKMVRSVDECPCPVITIVKGGAFGGGVGIVAASDIVIADEKAVFSLSEVKLGLIPATIGPIVMRKIGSSQARRLYLTGKRFSSKEAQAIGLVHEVAPVAALHSVAIDYLRNLQSSGPAAVRRAKRLIREMQGESLWSPEISETTSKVLSEVRIGAEAQEGVSAFLEKRKASWISKLVDE